MSYMPTIYKCYFDEPHQRSLKNKVFENLFSRWRSSKLWPWSLPWLLSVNLRHWSMDKLLALLFLAIVQAFNAMQKDSALHPQSTVTITTPRRRHVCELLREYFCLPKVDLKTSFQNVLIIFGSPPKKKFFGKFTQNLPN